MPLKICWTDLKDVAAHQANVSGLISAEFRRRSAGKRDLIGFFDRLRAVTYF